MSAQRLIRVCFRQLVRLRRTDGETVELHPGMIARLRAHVAWPLIADGRAVTMPDDQPETAGPPVAELPPWPPENPASVPYLNTGGGVVIPLDAPRLYRWWQGGQSIEKTRAELSRNHEATARPTIDNLPTRNT
jgi:hypothetical protein